MASVRACLAGALALFVGAAGCTSAPTPAHPAGAPTGQVWAFSDSAQVVDLVASGDGMLWVVGSHGLIRWDLQTGGFAALGREEGLPGRHGTAIATDARGTVFLATESGIARRDPGASKRWRLLPAPDVGDRVTALAASAAGILWAGGPAGTACWRGSGPWQRVLRGQSVSTILPDPDSDGAWIGTREAGLARIVAGKVALLGPTAGNLVRDVRGLAQSDDGGLVVVGMSGGHARLAFLAEKRTFSYRLEPDQEVGFLERTRGRLVLALGRALYALERATAERDPPGSLHIDAIDPPRGEHALPPPRWWGRPLELSLPPGVTRSFATSTDLWVGTRSLGVARWSGGGVAFYRTRDLIQGAQRLTVACASADECYLATGGPRAFWFDGHGFLPAEIDPEPGSRVLAVVHDTRHNVVAIHRGPSARGVRLSRVNQGVWSTIAMQDIQVPEGLPELTFAAFGPRVERGSRLASDDRSERLWLGLQYHEASGEARFFGAAEVDVEAGKVLYHRQFPRGTAPPPGTLPIPNDCTAVYFDVDTIWFATKSGATRVAPGPLRVQVFTENDGLESELVHDVAAGERPRQVVVATDRGVGQFDGRHWRFAREGALAWRARGLARAPDGTLWVATDHGLVALAPGGASTRVYDHRAGLLDDDVRDVDVDIKGRVWALSGQGVALIEP